ncbi:MAG: hypothetical protein V1809_09850 [Planctomycetota bacterium]
MTIVVSGINSSPRKVFERLVSELAVKNVVVEEVYGMKTIRWAEWYLRFKSDDGDSLKKMQEHGYVEWGYPDYVKAMRQSRMLGKKLLSEGACSQIYAKAFGYDGKFIVRGVNGELMFYNIYGSLNELPIPEGKPIPPCGPSGTDGAITTTPASRDNAPAGEGK